MTRSEHPDLHPDDLLEETDSSSGAGEETAPGPAEDATGDAFEGNVVEDEAEDSAGSEEDAAGAARGREIQHGPDEASMEVQLVEAQREAGEFRDKWMRAMAELENFRKRTRRDVQTSINLANANLLRQLLEVLDNFDRALESVPEGEDGVEDPFSQGVRLIREQLQTVLRESGCERIEAAGSSFDPNLHEAISQIESEEVPSGHVAQVVQEGYILRDLVLRPSRVVVAL